jgi:hypothetical protein
MLLVLPTATVPEMAARLAEEAACGTYTQKARTADAVACSRLFTLAENTTAPEAASVTDRIAHDAFSIAAVPAVAEIAIVSECASTIMALTSA